MKRLPLRGLIAAVAVATCSPLVFADAPKGKGKPAAKKPAVSKSKMTQTFEALDKNKDWELSFKELAVAIDRKKVQQAEQVFEKLQTESDPKSKFRESLNVTEFQKGYGQLKALTPRPEKKPSPPQKKQPGKKKPRKKKRR